MKNLFALLLCLFTAFSVLAQAPNANYDPDWDGDGNLGVDDLVGFLALFGDIDTDGDGIWDSVDDCTDLSACNFDSNPSVSCSYLDAIGICGGWCESDENGDGICDFTCGIDPIEYYGYSYATVQIGEQCWFAENLRTERYSQGGSIIYAPTQGQWNSASPNGAQCIYDNDESHLLTTGRLYNWYAATDDRGLCPSGWHVPSDNDYWELESEIGMNEMAQDSTGYRGTDQGTQLKSSSEDMIPWNGTNIQGFSLLPGGMRGPNGVFIYEGESCFLWTNTPMYPRNWYRRFQTEESGIFRGRWEEPYGFSIRCLKD